MAVSSERNPLNVDGQWSIDSRCIGCDAARNWAPGLIAGDEDGKSFVARQPATVEEDEAVWRAAIACPTQSIRSRDSKRPTKAAFPYEFTAGALAMGHSARSSFGAHSYLVQRPSGNLLIDSPRFERSMAERVDDLGGISDVFLSHRDDVADADRWADRYDARVWIHEADADAAPYATDIIKASRPTLVSAGVIALAASGHTKGHLVFHIDDRWLFTGNTLYWNHRRDVLDVWPGATWYRWDVLVETMDILAQLRVEWVFPGHGMWHQVGAAAYASQMNELGPSVRRRGQSDWSRRPRI